MAKSGVKTSGLSRGATILMIILGILTFIFVNRLAGIALILLGVAMYLFNRRFVARLQRSVEAGPSNPS